MVDQSNPASYELKPVVNNAEFKKEQEEQI